MPPRKPEGVIPDLLEDLKDFDDLAARPNGAVPVWDNVRKMWVPGTPAGGGGGGGAAPTAVSALILHNPATSYPTLVGTRDGKRWDFIFGPWPGTTQVYKRTLAHNGTTWLMGNQSVNQGTALASSDDGYMWDYVDSPFGTMDGSTALSPIAAVCWDDTNSLWLVVGQIGGTAYWFSSSPDLVTWSAPVSIDAALTGTYLEIETIAAHGGIIVAGTTNPEGYSDANNDYRSIFVSTDGGTTWTDPGLGGDPGNTIENSISTSYGVVWVHDRFFCTTDNSLGPGLWTSTDGVTWTEITVTGAGPALTYNSVAYGNGRFLVSSDQGNYPTSMLESLDGVTWTPVGDRFLYTGSPTALHSIGWIGDRFIAWGNGMGQMSEDGIAWAPTLIPFEGANINNALKLLVPAAA